MSDVPDDSIFEFPCRFPIKMMGRDDNRFRNVAVELVEAHVGRVSEDAISAASSSKGNFLSITVTIHAQNQEQLDDIYQALSDHDEILVAL